MLRVSFLEKRKELEISKSSTDIKEKEFERAGSDLQSATKVSFECSLLSERLKNHT